MANNAASPVIPIPLRGRAERRRMERLGAAMPVMVDGVETMTEDVSENGLSFHSDKPYELGARVQLTIDYLLDGHHYPWTCEAEVARIEPIADAWRVGARLLLDSEQDAPTANDAASSGAA